MTDVNADILKDQFPDDYGGVDHNETAPDGLSMDNDKENYMKEQEQDKKKEEIYAAGYFLFKHKQYSKAGQIFSILCQLHPHDARFYKGLGACWEKQGELQKAARAYKYASLMRIIDPMLHFQYAFCLVRLGQYEEAEFPLHMTISNAALSPNSQSLVSKANALLYHIEKHRSVEK